MTVASRARRLLGRRGRETPGTVLGRARRLDWRFLLPDVAGVERLGLVRVVAPDRVVADIALELDAARDVARGFDDDLVVDAAVVLTGDVADIARAAGTLRPGGVLYGEVDRGRRGAVAWSPARVRRRLEDRGLSTTVYWRWRHAGRDTLFLPLDVPGAVPWFLRELVDDRRRLRRTAQRLVLRLVRGGSSRLAPWVRHYSVVAVAVAAGGSDDGPSVLSPGILGEGAVGDRLPVVMARGEGSWSRVVLLPFDRGDDQPSAVVKLPRTSDHNAATEREQAVLSDLSERLPPELAVTVPRPRGLRYRSGLAVGEEQFLPGRPLAFASAGGRPSGLRLERAVDWLTALHGATRGADVPTGDERAGLLLDQPLLDLVDQLRMPVPGGRDGLLGQFSVARVTGAVLPVALQHCDLTPRNMRWDGRQHSVVDWESARQGPVLLDLLYLLLHWRWSSLPPFGQRPEQVFRALFVATDGVPASTARRHVRRYCEAMSLDDRLVPSLLLGMLTQQALDRAARVRDAGADPADDDNVYGRLVRVVLDSAAPVPTWGAAR